MDIKKIVLLHGLYMTPLVMKPMESNLKSNGYQVLNLGYNTLSPNPEKIFSDINSFIQGEPTVIIGHSMGGLIARHYIESKQPQSEHVTAVITLGTPHKSSSMARRIYGSVIGKILHESADYLLKEHEAWSFDAKLFSIAGTLPVGLLGIMHPDAASDGTVFVNETQIDGMSGHYPIKQTHTSMIYSKDVYGLIRHVLEYGALPKVA